MTYVDSKTLREIFRVHIHCVTKVHAVLPVSTVNAFVPEGGNEGEREATPTSISIFDFYDIKTL